MRPGKLATIIVTALFVITSAVLMRHGAWVSKTVATRSRPPASVTRVINAGQPMLDAVVVKAHDGDTITVEFDGRTERVRLIGVDTPEVSRNAKFKKDVNKDSKHSATELLDYGKDAREFTRSMVPPGTHVRLEFDVAERDRYGRLLAYVWVPAGDGNEYVMLNSTLLEEGLASVMTVPPNVKQADYFVSLQKTAREAGAGIWAGQ